MVNTKVAARRPDAVASGGREGTGGGPENPEQSRGTRVFRNSSGERSSASRLIDLELQLRTLTRAVTALAAQLGDEQLVHDLKHSLSKS